METTRTRTRQPRQQRTPRASRSPNGGSARANPQGQFTDVVMPEDDARFNDLHKALHEQLDAQTLAKPVNSRLRKAKADVHKLVTDVEASGNRLIVGNIALTGQVQNRSVPATFEKKDTIQFIVSDV